MTRRGARIQCKISEYELAFFHRDNLPSLLVDSIYLLPFEVFVTRFK